MTEYEYSKTIQQLDEKFHDKQFLGVAELAEYLAITPRTLTNAIGRGQLQAFKFGREYRIPRDAVKVFLESASADSADSEP